MPSLRITQSSGERQIDTEQTQPTHFELFVLDTVLSSILTLLIPTSVL